MPYRIGGGEPIADHHMQRLLADARHDGAHVEYTTRPHRGVQFPGEGDRFYDEED